MEINVINATDEVSFDALVAGVREYNTEMMGDEKSKPLSVVAHDENGKLIGGVAGQTIFNHYLISVVWVDKKVRGTGLGRRLMEQAEVEAKKRGCMSAELDTLSFQAPGFYAKLGYEVVGKVEGIPKGHHRYFLLKKFEPSLADS
ncbi:GNAT family N-acetyltransferase [Shewanella sp. VB17]|uniref:GNAT family N-acetyltransferase n=1 Tax=Shewanella sp. VB17 TaxID=2739432 RepID=UPI001562F9FD|nr:GNAT family N-acetyltransferase [Shewanella sp. VB17]NRD75450.1 GNAT family N-acetyltransferase [Shewanella sp. VB17]